MPGVGVVRSEGGEHASIFNAFRSRGKHRCFTEANGAFKPDRLEDAARTTSQWRIRKAAA
jgi:hypothetical protein